MCGIARYFFHVWVKVKTLATYIKAEWDSRIFAGAVPSPSLWISRIRKKELPAEKRETELLENIRDSLGKSPLSILSFPSH